MRNLILFLLLPITCSAQNFVKDHYIKREAYIPMRDGVRLYTAIYIPKNEQGGPYPFLMERTPYSAGPYGDSIYRGS